MNKQFLSPSMAIQNESIENELFLMSTHTPTVYFEKCKKLVKKICSLIPTLQKAFGVKSISPKPMRLKGRVLPAAPMTGQVNHFHQTGTVSKRADKEGAHLREDHSAVGQQDGAEVCLATRSDHADGGEDEGGGGENL